MLKVSVGGEGTDKALIRDEALLVSLLPYPPTDVPNNLIPFVGALAINGDGSTDLTVDGSVVPIDAFIGPPITGDLYLTTGNVLISQSGVVALNRFGGINNGLTNGLDFFVETENSRFLVASSLKTNFDMIRIATKTQGTGGKNDAYLLANTNPANEDGYNPILDFTAVSPLGIRLRKDTLDKLGVRINDDLRALGTFNIVITGYVRI